MLVRRRKASLNPRSTIRLRMVETTTTTSITIMGRKESIPIISRLTLTKEHGPITVITGQVMWNTLNAPSARKDILGSVVQTPRVFSIVARKVIRKRSVYS